MSPLWVAFDCETTGFPPNARLIEVGAVSFRDDGRIEGEFQELIRPPIALPTFITELTGITPAMVSTAEGAAAVLERFLTWATGGILVAHNIAFDLTVIAAEFGGCLDSLRTCVDSLDIARRLGEFSNNRLTTIAEALKCSRRPHRAIDDAHVVRQLMCHAFKSDLRRRSPELFIGLPVSTFLPPFDAAKRH